MASIRIATTHRDRAVLFTPLENSPVIATLRATSVIITDNTFKAAGDKKEPATVQEVNIYLKELLDKQFPEVTGPKR